MPVGTTVTGSVADSLDDVTSSARIVREYDGVMPRLVDRQTLGEGIGLTWNEVDFSQLAAQAVQETETLNNPQQLVDTNFPVTPTVVGIQTLITRRTKARMAKVAFSKIGQLGQNAITRLKDEDGLAVFAGAGTEHVGTGNALTQGHLSSAVTVITSNVTEPGPMPIHIVLHGFQIHDITVELVQGINPTTNPEQLLTTGISAEVFRQRFRGMVGGGMVFEDGNITIDGTPDARGGVFSKMGIVLVQGRSPWAFSRLEPAVGGGADSIFLYDEYAYGERSSGNWLISIFSDATTPSS